MRGAAGFRDKGLVRSFHDVNIHATVVDGVKAVVFSETFDLTQTVGGTDQRDPGRRPQDGRRPILVGDVELAVERSHRLAEN